MTAAPSLTQLVARQLEEKGLCTHATISPGSSHIVTELGDVFVKSVNSSDPAGDLNYEAQGLRALNKAATESGAVLALPSVWLVDTAGDTPFLAMDYLRFGSGTRTSLAQLGDGLGKIHNHAAKRSTFGFDIDGCLGASPQLNNIQFRSLNWLEFWKEYRLGHQLEMAKSKFPIDTEIQHLGAELMHTLPDLFSMLVVEDIKPSLLHGDLWSGNWSILEDGRPCIFDPACYYGHHEADLGIMHMFGGFPPTFWDAYHNQVPKQLGFDKRALLYELHHHLNHMNLFGSGYRTGVIQLMQKILNRK